MAETARAARLRVWLTVLFGFLILIPSMLGFGNKFLELIHVFGGEAEGAFAIAPILNYLLASAGFLLMLLWAASLGMFRNLESPKHEMLANEAMLDGDAPPAA